MEEKFRHLEIPNLASLIHQAVLDPHLDANSLDKICGISKELNFSGICTNLTLLPKVRKRLGKSNPTKLIAVIAFPFGTIPSALKVNEAEWAISQGSEELEVVPNFFALKQNKVDLFAEELSRICELDVPVRSILNMAFLSQEELSIAVNASIEAGVIGVQTGNGFGRHVSREDITQIKQLIRDRCEVKAVGGLRTLTKSLEMIEAGASLIGTTAGPEIINTLKKMNK